MPDTLPDTTLPKNTPVDLYDATGISVATAITVQNIGSTIVELYSGLAAPVIGASGKRLIKPFETWQNDASDAGAWAISPNTDGLINVGEVV